MMNKGRRFMKNNNRNYRYGIKNTTIIIAEMGAKHSRLSEEDFLFLEEETGMSKATLEVSMDIRFSLWY